MPTIKVTAKIGGTHHPKYGLLEKGKEYAIEVEGFAEQLFNEPLLEQDKNALDEYRRNRNKKAEPVSHKINFPSLSPLPDGERIKERGKIKKKEE